MTVFSFAMLTSSLFRGMVSEKTEPEPRRTTYNTAFSSHRLGVSADDQQAKTQVAVPYRSNCRECSPR